VISVHCHNDLGLAVANSLAAVEAGAGQVECTINGIGERAGNCSLEEIVMALRTRHDFYHSDTKIATKRLVPISRLVSNITGIQVQRNKAIVGQNAFAHEAGIHQDGYLKERTTYEIMHPEDVGFSRTDLVLGKHSGRAALADRAKTLGYNLTGEQLDTVFAAFKDLADKKKEIYDGDIASLVEQQIHSIEEQWRLDSYKVVCGTGQVPEVVLRLKRGDKKFTTTVASGDGPIDAVFVAIEQLTGMAVECRDFTVHSVTLGKDAQGEVMVQVEHEGQIYRGRGVSTDSVEASARAFLNAVNRILAVKGRAKDEAAK
jgi:2-isopropylmalate synthase